MSLSLDLQYAGMISSRVRNYRRAGTALNFSCPYCGDSATNKSKARGFLYRKADSLFYKCWNCETPKHDLASLLAVVDPNLAQQYKIERFLEKKSEWKPQEPTVKQPKFIKSIHEDLMKVSSLPGFHRAKKYLVERRIPSDKHYLFYYTPIWKQFAHQIDANVFTEFDPIQMKDEPRLVIPLVEKNGGIAGYQGRAFGPSDGPKYQTLLTHEDNPKIFGLDRADTNYLIRAFEGPIDSVFIDNAIAVCGSRIDTALAELDKSRLTIVYDNEPRKPETIKKIEKAIANGFRVCIWPESLNESDVNAMVLAGKAPSEIAQIIDDHTYQGLRAELALKKWKRI